MKRVLRAFLLSLVCGLVWSFLSVFLVGPALARRRSNPELIARLTERIEVRLKSPWSVERRLEQTEPKRLPRVQSAEVAARFLAGETIRELAQE